MPEVPLHVVFSAECNHLFDWHSVALFHSFKTSGQHGNMTRLLACSAEQLKQYPKTNLEMGPTFVHRNMRDDPLVDEKGYPSYNKPYSVMAWLAEADVSEEYVLMMDGDMILRKPLDPVALGVARGRVVSAEYTYLVGTDPASGFAERFIAKQLVPRLAQVGGFHIFHREDLRLIAPKWLEYTKRVRAFAHAEPETFFAESMSKPEPGTDASTIATRKKQSQWHSEMYGYVFAAAEVGVTHRVRRDVMLYPGYVPYMGRGPNILHYGSDYKVGEAYFNKMMHTELKLESCPSFQFAAPENPNFDSMSKRDALCIEHLATMNAAFCGFYATIGCSPLQTPAGCSPAAAATRQLHTQRSREVLTRCLDDNAECANWQRSGECSRNPAFMHSSCPKACGSCDTPLDDLVDADRHLGDWKYAAAQAGHPIPDPSPPPPPPPPSPPPLADGGAASDGAPTTRPPEPITHAPASALAAGHKLGHAPGHAPGELPSHRNALEAAREAASNAALGVGDGHGGGRFDVGDGEVADAEALEALAGSDAGKDAGKDAGSAPASVADVAATQAGRAEAAGGVEAGEASEAPSMPKRRRRRPLPMSDAALYRLLGGGALLVGGYFVARRLGGRAPKEKLEAKCAV